MKKFLFFLILAPGLMFPVKLTITVKDKSDSPIATATVAVIELGLESNTDKDGRAVLTVPTEGALEIIAIKEGYEKTTQKVVVGAKDAAVVMVMAAAVARIDEVMVRGRKNTDSVTTRTVIRKEDFKRTSKFLMGDSIKTLQTMPGVSSSGGAFDSRMYIQGGANSEWIAMMDGILILSPTRWGGNLSMFNPEVIDSIDLYTAGYPAAYTQGLSGLLLVNTISGRKDRWGGFFDWSPATMEIGLSGPLAKDFTVFFNFRRTYYEWIASLFIPEGAREGIQFPYLMDGLLKFHWDISPFDTISWTNYGSIEGMKFDLDLNLGSVGPPPDLSGQFFYQTINPISGMKYIHRFSDTHFIDALLAFVPQFGVNKANISTSGAIVNSYQKADQYGYEVMLNHHVTLGDAHQFKSGVFAGFFQISAQVDVDVWSFDEAGDWKKNRIEKTYDRLTFPFYSAYLQDDWKIFGPLVLQAGVRADYLQLKSNWLNNEMNINPRGGLKVQLFKDFDFFVRSGMYGLIPTNVIKVDEEYGNPDLRSQKVTHVTSGFDLENRAVTFRLEGFYKKYYHLHTDDLKYNYLNQGERWVAGGDVYLQKKETKSDWYNGWISYTYVYGFEKVRDRSPGEYSVPLDEWFVPGYMRRHTVSTILEMKYRKNEGTAWLNWMDEWKIAFDFRFLSGRPYTPVVDVIRYEIPGAGTKYVFEYGDTNSQYSPPFHKMDIKLTFPFSLFDIFKLLKWNVRSETYFSFLNVYNNKNIMDYYYAVSEQELNRRKEKEKITVPTTERLGPEGFSRKASTDLPFIFLGGMRFEF